MRDSKGLRKCSVLLQYTVHCIDKRLELRDLAFRDLASNPIPSARAVCKYNELYVAAATGNYAWPVSFSTCERFQTAAAVAASYGTQATNKSRSWTSPHTGARMFSKTERAAAEL